MAAKSTWMIGWDTPPAHITPTRRRVYGFRAEPKTLGFEGEGEAHAAPREGSRYTAACGQLLRMVDERSWPPRGPICQECLRLTASPS